MIRRLFTLALGAIFALGTANLATAGNIALTGHDDDYHDFFGSAAGNAQLTALVSFVRAGSALKVLTFDEGTELTASLTAMGVAFDNVAAPGGVAAGLFDPTVYSAMIVASAVSCGGCDNSPAMGLALAAESAAITAFLNAGGGILALSGASDATYYSFLPETASAPSGAPSTGYAQTAAGLLYGIPEVNGDPTHNVFDEPGTGGTSAAYLVAERLGTATSGDAETLLCVACTVGGGVITSGVPEPGSIMLFGTVLAFVSLKLRKRISSN